MCKFLFLGESRNKRLNMVKWGTEVNPTNHSTLYKSATSKLSLKNGVFFKVIAKMLYGCPPSLHVDTLLNIH